MDIVLVCKITNLYKSLDYILLSDIIAAVSEKHNIDIKLDYKRSKIFINILGNKGNFMYIKKCKIDELLEEIKKIESI